MSSTTELSTWLNGTPTGGPEGDGRYPLTYQDGLTYLVYCPAAQALNPALAEQPVETFANTASAAAATATTESAEAEQASLDAQTAAANAAASATTANTHKNAAATSATAAATSATNAGTSATAAANSAALADADRIAAELARDEAEAAAAAVSGALAVGEAFEDAFATNPSYYADGAGKDCDTLLAGSRALVAVTGNTNTPSVAGVLFWHIETVNSFTGVATLFQRAFAYDAPNAVAYRLLQGGAWTAWTYEWNTGNFDPTLKLDKAGGTMTGVLTTQKVGVGLSVKNATGANALEIGQGYSTDTDGHAWLYNRANGDIVLGSNNLERGRVKAAGHLNWTGGELQTTTANGVRLIQGNYGAFFRNDGTSFYLLFTNSADQYGSWNALRPLTISLATGVVTMAEGLVVTAQIQAPEGIAVNAAVDGGGDNGIRLWSPTDNNWGIYVATAGATKSLAGGTAPTPLNGRTSHHVRFRASTSSVITQGFNWENGSEVSLMSLNNDDGYLYVKGRVITQGSHFSSSTTSVVLGCAAAGIAYIRPNGVDAAPGEMKVLASGFVGIGNITPGFMLDVNGRGRIRYNGVSAGLWYQNSAGTDKWFVGSNTDSFMGVFNTTNSWVWQVQDDGRTQIKNANSGTFTTQPRIFVQSTDPGAAAADGDIWIQI